MGKEVIKFARKKGHQIIDIFDIDNQDKIKIENLQKADVVFEFTTPKSAFDNINKCFDAQVACVCGTTGWLDKLDIIKLRCEEEKQTFFYASNFSIGVNILFKINKILANIMNNYPQYNVAISETHHIHKIDAPSGTAIQIANQIIEKIERKKNWQLNKASEDEILIQSFREGEIPGIHIVKYDSEVDTIEIKHSAKNRQGLAQGAVLAAEFVKDKKGFYTMEDLLNV